MAFCLGRLARSTTLPLPGTFVPVPTGISWTPPITSLQSAQHGRATDRVVGAYHSHPTGAPVPSVVDLREARDAMYVEFVYLIVSLGNSLAGEGEIAGYRLRGASFETVDLTAIG